jgi:ParB family chromosome partitioning protein
VRLGAAPSAAPRASSPPVPDADDCEAQRMFEGLLETPVQLARHGGAITLTITFYSDDQIQGFYDRLTGGPGEG